MPKPGRDRITIDLRNLRARLKAYAKAERRSLSSAVRHLIEVGLRHVQVDAEAQRRAEYERLRREFE